MSRHPILWVAVVLLGMTTARPAPGQDTGSDDASDLEGWAAAELKYKAGKRWVLSTEGQLRMKDDISEVDQYFFQLGARFNLLSRVYLDGGLRFIRRNDTEGKIQGFESERRQHLSAFYRPRLGRFSLGLRVRYQTEGDVGSAGYEETDRYLRFRARARYNIRNWKFDPDLAAELYRPVDGAGDSYFDKVRFTLGTTWDARGGSEVGMFYRIERELGVESPRTTHIVGLRFTYTLGRN